MYCVQENGPYLKGNKNDYYHGEKHSFFIYEIHRCNEALRNTTEVCDQDECQAQDPECAPESEIDEWLSTKKAIIKVIDNKIDFTNWIVPNH